MSSTKNDKDFTFRSNVAELMPNPNYLKGVRKERKLVRWAKDRGMIALRSAGSHSPIDVVIIDKYMNLIRLVQCKPHNYPRSYKKKLYEKYGYLTGKWDVEFIVD